MINLTTMKRLTTALVGSFCTASLNNCWASLNWFLPSARNPLKIKVYCKPIRSIKYKRSDFIFTVFPVADNVTLKNYLLIHEMSYFGFFIIWSGFIIFFCFVEVSLSGRYVTHLERENTSLQLCMVPKILRQTFLSPWENLLWEEVADKMDTN